MILSKRFDNYFEESRKGLQKWEEMVKTFGFGNPLGVDVPEEKEALYPMLTFMTNGTEKRDGLLVLFTLTALEKVK